MKTTDNINYEADRGKVFIRKSDNRVMGYGLGLGASDSIDNYCEADCPEEYKGEDGYDNTIEEVTFITDPDLLLNVGGVGDSHTED